MSKRNTVQASILSALALTMLCLCSSDATAQTGTPNTNGVPIRGIDVKLGKNPGGNAAARTATTNDKGEVTFTGLAPGNYSLTIVDPSRQQKGIKGGSQGGDTDVHQNYLVEIVGAVGGPITREWNVQEGKFAALSNATAKAMSAPHYEEKISFDIGGGTPVLRIIVKAHSNAINNRGQLP